MLPRVFSLQSPSERRVGWIESQVRDEGGRRTLWDLEQVRAQWSGGADDPARLLLDKLIAALLRRWADT